MKYDIITKEQICKLFDKIKYVYNPDEIKVIIYSNGDATFEIYRDNLNEWIPVLVDVAPDNFDKAFSYLDEML